MTNGTTSPGPSEKQRRSRARNLARANAARRGGEPGGALGADVDREEYPYICRAAGPRNGQRCRYTHIPSLSSMVQVQFPDGQWESFPRSVIRRG
jgi:hypothetical protein